MLEQNEEWIEEWFEADPDSAADGVDFYEAFCVAKKKTNCKSKTAFGPKLPGVFILIVDYRFFNLNI